MSEKLKWHTGTPGGFVVAVFEWYNGIDTETTYGIYDPREREWTDGNCGVMVTPDRWIDATDYIAGMRAELAAAKAEVERLKGIIRKVEWDFKIGEYDAYHDVTTTDKYECLHCGFIFFSEMTRSHAESCPLYQWEAAQ